MSSKSKGDRKEAGKGHFFSREDIEASALSLSRLIIIATISIMHKAHVSEILEWGPVSVF